MSGATINISGSNNDSNLVLTSPNATVTDNGNADATHECNCNSVNDKFELMFKYNKALVLNDKCYNHNLLLGSTAKLYTDTLKFIGVYSADTSGSNVFVEPSSNMVVNQVVGSCLQQLGNVQIPKNLHNCPGTVSLYLWLVSPVFGGPCLKNGKLTAESPNFLKLMNAHSTLYQYEINVGRDAYKMSYLNSDGISWYPYIKITDDDGKVLLDGFHSGDTFYQYENKQNAPTIEEVKKVFTDSWDAIEDLIVEQSFTTFEANMLRSSQYLTYYHAAVLSMGTSYTYQYKKSQNGQWVDSVNKDISCTDYVAKRDEFYLSLYPVNTQFPNNRACMLWYNNGMFNPAMPCRVIADGVATTFKELELSNGGPKSIERILPLYTKTKVAGESPSVAADETTFSCC